MIRIAIQGCFTVITLLLSVCAAMAADCADDPKECTLEKLCEIATSSENGNIVWSTELLSSKHTAVAKNLNLKCGVTSVVDACDVSPGDCKLKQLCGKATKILAGQKIWDTHASAYVDLAKEYGLQCDVKEDVAFNNFENEFRGAFLSETKLKRKQLQFALKELGLYPSSIDGIWGKGTRLAFENYVQANNQKNSSVTSVFSRLLTEVTVPSSFSSKKKNAMMAPVKMSWEDDLVAQYVCETRKVDVKSGIFSLSTNNGMTSATITFEGQKQKISGNDLQAALRDLNLDQASFIGFTEDEAIIIAANWKETIGKEFSKSSEEYEKLSSSEKKIIDQFIAPVKYYEKNSLRNWTQKMPMDFGGGSLRHSFNLTSKKYVGKGAITLPGESQKLRVTTLATCKQS